MKLVGRILVFFMLITQAHSLFAWGMTGHRVISEIAEQHLTRKAKRNIQKLPTGPIGQILLSLPRILSF